MENSIRKTMLTLTSENRVLERLWRSRVRRVCGGGHHRKLADNPKIFLHLMPIDNSSFNIDSRKSDLRELQYKIPLASGHHAHYYRVNIDGLFNFSASPKDESLIISYAHLFWDGSVEFCDAYFWQSSK
ncbi:MAG: hypothetical protein HC914_20640 [Chloroflexaceae bacterium]|nr:hypothetical protein [Chloroflexaceae bacterium]